jgi:hypothetical protein
MTNKTKNEESVTPAESEFATGHTQAPTASNKPSEGASGVSLGTCLLMCGFTLALTLSIGAFAPQIASKYGFSLPGSTPAVSKVVYLDFEKLLEAGIKHSTGMEQSDLALITKEADKFQADIGVLLQKYAAEGYLVINSKALIVGAKGQDITPIFIKGLGLVPAQ